jgi:uncharacterized metal-binding protein YceD (DUF177 family)
MIALELHRPINLDHIGASGLTVTVEASPAECAALAARMRLPAVHALTCEFRLTGGEQSHFAARGHLRACITQTCVVTLEDFETEVEEVFQVHFVPAGEESEIIDPEADDDLPYEGNSIDLGEAAAEQLALALDPYPRSPGAELPQELLDEAPHPFAALGSLRKLN